jgi:hypothetical protein
VPWRLLQQVDDGPLRQECGWRVVLRDAAELARDRGNVVHLRRVHDPVVVTQFDPLSRQAAEEGVLQHVASVLVLEHDNQHATKGSLGAETH